MVRDIFSNRVSFLACLIIAVMGLMIFTSFSILRNNLTLSQESIYREQNFADGFMETLFPDSEGLVNDVVFTLEGEALFDQIKQNLE